MYILWLELSIGLRWVGMVTVLPTNASIQGLSYTDWTANWWIWIYSIPKAINPLLDSDEQQALKISQEACGSWSGHTTPEIVLRTIKE